MISRDELLKRITDFEDAFTERKPEGVSSGEIRETLVAFANTVMSPRVAVLFWGVADDGHIVGLTNPDSQQKTLRRLCDRDCYPAILYQAEVITVESRSVLAVAIPESGKKPHFAGGCFVRRGSQNMPASDEEFRELLLHQVDKFREIMRHKDKLWYVRSYGRQLSDPRALGADVEEGVECRIEGANAFYVRFRRVGSDDVFSIEMAALSLLWDEKRHGPMAVVRPIRYAGST